MTMRDDFHALGDHLRTSRQRQRDEHARRLRYLEAKGLVTLRWFTPYHVRVTPTASRQSIDFWPTSGRGRGHRVSLHGWPALMSALGIDDPFGDPPEAV